MDAINAVCIPAGSGVAARRILLEAARSTLITPLDVSLNMRVGFGAWLNGLIEIEGSKIHLRATGALIWGFNLFQGGLFTTPCFYPAQIGRNALGNQVLREAQRYDYATDVGGRAGFTGPMSVCLLCV